MMKIMSLVRKIARNTAIHIAGRIVSLGISFATIGIVARHLHPEGMGNYTTTIAFLQVFGIVVDMGLYIILLTKISENPPNLRDLVNNIFTLRLLSAILFLGIAPLLVFLFPYPPVVKEGVAIAVFYFLFTTMSQLLSGLFQKNFRTDRIVIADITGRLVQLAITLLIIQREGGLQGILLALVVGSLVQLSLLILFTHRFIRLRLQFNRVIWKEVMKQAWPIAIAIGFNLVYFKADTLILAHFRSQEEVGIYGVPYRILEVLIAFPAMFAGLVTPSLTKHYREGRIQNFQNVFQRSFDALAVAAIPMMVGTLIVAERSIVAMFGREYTVSASLLKILIVATGMIFVGNLFGNTVVAINRQRTILKAYAANAILSIIGYLIFIPRYSYFGAAWMTVLSEFFITVSTVFLVLRTTKIRLNLAVLAKAILSTLIMGSLLWVFQGLPLLLWIGVGVAIYGVTLYLFRGIPKEVIQEILAIKS